MGANTWIGRPQHKKNFEMNLTLTKTDINRNQRVTITIFIPLRYLRFKIFKLNLQIGNPEIILSHENLTSIGMTTLYH